MECLWKLTYLLEPALLLLTFIVTAVAVTFGSAYRALIYAKEMERKNRVFSEVSITLDSSQVRMIQLISSYSPLIMFYLFSSVSQLLTAFIAIVSVSSLYFCFSPYIVPLKSQFGSTVPYFSRCCSESFICFQGLLLYLCIGTVVAWFVTGHWLLNNLLGISLCIAFVSHVRLPNIKICAMLLAFSFMDDICWFFFSEENFGGNVMMSVATQKVSNPLYILATRLSLPGVQFITKHLVLPLKIVFPLNLYGVEAPSGSNVDYVMLGLLDMAIPALLPALVLCFDDRKCRDSRRPLKYNYTRYAVTGYALGLVIVLAATILTHSPQPALLYLVPSTLGPIIFISWMRKEFLEIWEGTSPIVNKRAHSELSN